MKMFDIAPSIRQAQSTDIPELHALIESAYLGETAKACWTHEADLLDEPQISQEALESIVANSNEVLLVALQDARIIGGVQITRRSATTSYSGLLTVDPNRQATELGKYLMQAAESEAQRRFGSKKMELSVVSQRSELIAYYERRGYALSEEQCPFPSLSIRPSPLWCLIKFLVSNGCSG